MVERTENVLLAASKAKNAPAPKEKQAVAKKAEAPTQGYVPPPPPNGAKITPPAGMPPVKTFPISTGPPPSNMTFPGLQSAAPV